MSTGYYFIQSDEPNVWFNAQKWQRNFLSDESLLKSSFYRNHSNVYMKHDIVDIPADLSIDENIKEAFYSCDLSKLPKYTNQNSWFPSFMSWSTDDSYIFRVGVIVNITTGTSRFFFYTTDPNVFVKHNGITKISQESINKYNVQFQNNLFVPKVE